MTRTKPTAPLNSAPRWKRSFAMICLTIGLVSACTGDTAIVDPALELRLARQADFQFRRAKAAKVGDFHTRALDFVRRDVTRYSAAETRTVAEGMAYAEASCTRFMRSEGRSYTCVLPRDGGRVSHQINVLPASAGKPRFDLSSTAQGYLAQIQSAADNATSAANFASVAEGIAFSAQWELSGEDLDAVLEAEAVGNSSFHYWTYNGAYFIAEYVYNNNLNVEVADAYTIMVNPHVGPRIAGNVITNGPGGIRFGWFKWKQTAAMDVGGCIGAAIVSAGALCGEGAVAGSVADAIAQILQRI